MTHTLKSLLLAATLVAALAVPPALAAAKPHKRACAAPAGQRAACHALVVTDATGTPAATSAPTGYGSADLQGAYALPSATAGSGQTIALVDAYDDPSAESDLATYRAYYGLPPCTTANGCFSKRNQSGGTGYPASDAGWSEEISLDLDVASAICPKCRILLVEASSSSITDLGSAENEAVALGANTISNSYGAGEFPGESLYASYFNHPGVAIAASSGDNGYPDVEFPAVLPTVTAVGGTHLARAGDGRGWVESAWSGASSGCSAYVAKPSWQHDPGCSGRTVADVSADSDPATGIAAYDSGQGGWLQFGGTSAASPLVAATYALAGNAAAVSDSSLPYAHAGALFDTGQTFYSRVRSEAGLHDYWRLGEASGTGAADQTGAAPGTYAGGVTLAQPGALSGDSNTAASFDGTGYVSLPTLGSFNDLTIEGWTNLTSAASSSLYGNNTLYGRYGYARLIVRPSGVYGGVWIGGTEYGVQVTTATNVGWWHAWALVRSGTTLTVYRDGVAVGSRTAPTGSATLAGTIGTQGGAQQYQLHGSVDEVAVYGSALSAAAVKDHWYLGANGALGGSNGSCSGSYLCTALPGFDGPTGLGTPAGAGAF